MNQNHITEEKKVRKMLPKQFVKPLKQYLREVGAPIEVIGFSREYMSKVVNHELEGSPLWPYVIGFAEQRKELTARRNKL